MTEQRYLLAITAGVLSGIIARYLMLRSDYRQFPGYPHGYVTHLSLGLVAALLGALAVPALIAKEYTAVTFLSLAATQFRDIREIERKTLVNLEATYLVPRGFDYIEGIARVFEARNYLVMLIALLVSGFTFFLGLPLGLAAGLAALLAARSLMDGPTVQDIAVVRPGKIRFEGPNLFVERIHFMNLATAEVRETYLERGLGVVIEPFDDDARAALATAGQRLAIAHDAAVQLGIYKDVDTAMFTPVLRRCLDTGRIAMVILPIERDLDCLLLAVRRAPILESSRSRPLQSRAGRGAAD